MQPRLKPKAVASLLVLVATGLGLAACGGGGNTASEKAATAPTTATTTPSKPATVNAARVESTLKRNFRGIGLPAVPATVYPSGGGPPQQTPIGGGRLKVRSVTCPDNVPAQRGGTFDCDIDAGKTSATVRLTQLNDSGTRLRFKATFKSEMTAGVTGTTRIHGQIKVTP